MKCSYCGAENSENAKFCTSCGKRIDEKYEIKEKQPEVIPEYSTASAICAIIVSVICCVGWLGIIFAILSLCDGSNVKTLVNCGKYEEAKIKLDQANKWSKISWIIIAFSIVISIIVCGIYIILIYKGAISGGTY